MKKLSLPYLTCWGIGCLILGNTLTAQPHESLARAWSAGCGPQPQAFVARLPGGWDDLWRLGAGELLAELAEFDPRRVLESAVHDVAVDPLTGEVAAVGEVLLAPLDGGCRSAIQPPGTSSHCELELVNITPLSETTILAPDYLPERIAALEGVDGFVIVLDHVKSPGATELHGLDLEFEITNPSCGQALTFHLDLMHQNSAQYEMDVLLQHTNGDFVSIFSSPQPATGAFSAVIGPVDASPYILPGSRVVLRGQMMFSMCNLEGQAPDCGDSEWESGGGGLGSS